MDSVILVFLLPDAAGQVAGRGRASPRLLGSLGGLRYLSGGTSGAIGWGRRTMRVSGATWLARSEVPVSQAQTFVRSAPLIVMRYIGKGHIVDIGALIDPQTSADESHVVGASVTATKSAPTPQCVRCTADSGANVASSLRQSTRGNRLTVGGYPPGGSAIAGTPESVGPRHRRATWGPPFRENSACWRVGGSGQCSKVAESNMSCGSQSRVCIWIGGWDERDSCGHFGASSPQTHQQ